MNKKEISEIKKNFSEDCGFFTVLMFLPVHFFNTLSSGFRDFTIRFQIILDVVFINIS